MIHEGQVLLPSVRELREKLTGASEWFRGKFGRLSLSWIILYVIVAAWMVVAYLLHCIFNVNIPLWMLLGTLVWVVITLALQIVSMCWELVKFFTALRKASILDQSIDKEQKIIRELQVYPGKLLDNLEQRLLIELEMTKYTSEALPAIGAALGVILAVVIASKSAASLGSFPQPHIPLSLLCELVLLSSILACILASFATIGNKRVLRRLAWILQQASERGKESFLL